MNSSFSLFSFRQEIFDELTQRILPFWITYPVDRRKGGFYGALTNDLQVHDEVPRSSILCARILWTFSAAYRRLREESYLDMARWAYDYLMRVFWDREYEGVYWEVDSQGQPVIDRKHHYAQAFALYALSEYYRATGEPRSLALLQILFERLERHGFEPRYGGYLEGSSRDWGVLKDMRLSTKDLNSRKSMNTCLHILEAYTNLLRVWNDARLREQHRALIETFLSHILDSATGHLKLFFDDSWHSLSQTVSYGHDIECSWLLWEAVALHPDSSLRHRVCQATLLLAEGVYREGLDRDGSVLPEKEGHIPAEVEKEWWAQAEAVIGFWNAYQISGREHYLQAAWRVWKSIDEKFLDRQHGDWFKRLLPDGRPNPDSWKVGPWECPYHHSRMCFELLDRLVE